MRAIMPVPSTPLTAVVMLHCTSRNTSRGKPPRKPRPPVQFQDVLLGCCGFDAEYQTPLARVPGCLGIDSVCSSSKQCMQTNTNNGHAPWYSC